MAKYAKLRHKKYKAHPAPVDGVLDITISNTTSDKIIDPFLSISFETDTHRTSLTLDAKDVEMLKMAIDVFERQNPKRV